MTTLLILGGGTEAAHVVARAHLMGHSVVVGCPDADEPAARAAEWHIACDPYQDPAGTVAECVRRCLIRVVSNRITVGIDAVLCGCIDTPLVAALIARALHLPGLPVGVARIFGDKALQMQAARDCYPVWLGHGGDVVIKPPDSRGTRGVSIVHHAATGPAVSLAQTESPTGRAIRQRYIPGPQVSTEGVVLGGTYHSVAIADRYYPEPLNEQGGNMPSTLPEDTQTAIVRLIQRAVTAFNADNCIVKGDVVVDSDGRPWLLELAGRLSGGQFSTEMIPAATGVQLVDIAIRLALGETVAPPVPRSPVIPHARRGQVVARGETVDEAIRKAEEGR